FSKGFVPDDGLPPTHRLAALIGVLTIVVLVVWKPLAPRPLKVVPAALLAVGLATALAHFGGLPVERLDIRENLLNAVRLPPAARGAPAAPGRRRHLAGGPGGRADRQCRDAAVCDGGRSAPFRAADELQPRAGRPGRRQPAVRPGRGAAADRRDRAQLRQRRG